MLDYTQFEGHTPGPWDVAKPSELENWGSTWRNYRLDVQNSKNNICHLPVEQGLDSDERLANANLVAAAPDLLDENKRLREALDSVKTRIYYSAGKSDQKELMKSLLFICEQALAGTEGGV